MNTTEHKCCKCNSSMVKANVDTTIRIYGEEIHRPPLAAYQKSYFPVYALVCESCGYIELYTRPNINLEDK